MKLRLFTGLAIALALGGCTTYGYVGDGGGGYYSGAPYTQYSYVTPGAYGYAGYGSYYRYNPGWSYGLGYGYPGYYPYGGYGGGGYYRPPYGYSRPPYYYPRPPRPQHHDGRPDHGGRPDYDGRPDRPNAGNQPPPLNRAPWRDLERLRRGEYGGEYPGRQPGPGTMSVGGQRPGASGAMPGVRSGYGARPMPPNGYGVSGDRGRAVSMDGGPSQRAMQPRVERAEQPPQRNASRSSESRRERPDQSGTPDTIEP